MSLTLDPWYSDNYTRMKKLKNKFWNGELVLSPYLHRKVYGETLGKEWTPNVEQHVKIFYGPAGGINLNDYFYIPIEFRKLFLGLFSEHTLTEYPNIFDTCQDIFDYLEEKYQVKDCLANVLVTMYMSSGSYSYIKDWLIEDSRK